MVIVLFCATSGRSSDSERIPRFLGGYFPYATFSLQPSASVTLLMVENLG